MGHSRPDPTPGQWNDHCQQMWLEDIFIQGVFKDLCSCDFLFLFSVVVFFEILKVGRKKKKETKTYFWLTHFFK